MPRRAAAQLQTLSERLKSECERLRIQASSETDIVKRDDLLKRARQYETSTQMDGYLRSDELRAPT